MKKLRVLLCIFSIVVVFVFWGNITSKGAGGIAPCYILPDGSVYCGWDLPTPTYPISLNEKSSVTLQAGDEKKYTITLPDKKYYIVETFGNNDTYLTIENLTGGTLTDDDGGEGYNAAIGFKGETRKINIITRFYSSTKSGTFKLQIRKQQAVLYGFDYDDIDTTPDLDKPYDYLKSLYHVYKFEDKSSSHILDKDERDIERLNSEIVFFSGHGYKTSETHKGYGVAFNPGSLMVHDLASMENVKVAMWSACYSSSKENNYDTSMIDSSVAAGAKSAVGFNQSVTVSSSKTFTNRFFNKLSEGGTVSDAASYGASGLWWPWDNGKDYRIAGNKNTKITTASINKSSINQNEMLLNEFNTKLKEKNYVSYKITDNIIRYYKTIDGLLTNDFYDIYYSASNNINHIKHSGHNIISEKALPINVKSTTIFNTFMENGILFNKLTDIETHYVYCIIDNKLVPIEIKYCTYESDFGIITVFADCTNLYNGEKINYEEICGE